MRKRFSEQYGFVEPRDAFQVDGIDDKLKNRIWNIIKNIFIDTIETNHNAGYNTPNTQRSKNFVVDVYDKFFKDNIDPLEYRKDTIRKDLKRRFFELEWFEVYDFLEILPNLHYLTSSPFYEKTNIVLQEENSAYRFVDEYVTPIIDEIEIQEIEEALGSEYSPVKRHLSNALEFLSDRENPDYQNSIKESISAVESLVNIVSSKKDIALNKCINYHLPFEIDSSFKKAMINLYSWTSSADGIRHGSTEEELRSSFEEAKYMLVNCSAFVNYLIAKKEASES